MMQYYEIPKPVWYIQQSFHALQESRHDLAEISCQEGSWQPETVSPAWEDAEEKERKEKEQLILSPKQQKKLSMQDDPSFEYMYISPKSSKKNCVSQRTSRGITPYIIKRLQSVIRNRHTLLTFSDPTSNSTVRPTPYSQIWQCLHVLI